MLRSKNTPTKQALAESVRATKSTKVKQNMKWLDVMRETAKKVIGM